MSGRGLRATPVQSMFNCRSRMELSSPTSHLVTGCVRLSWVISKTLNHQVTVVTNPFLRAVMKLQVLCCAKESCAHEDGEGDVAEPFECGVESFVGGEMSKEREFINSTLG